MRGFGYPAAISAAEGISRKEREPNSDCKIGSEDFISVTREPNSECENGSEDFITVKEKSKRQGGA